MFDFKKKWLGPNSIIAIKNITEGNIPDFFYVFFYFRWYGNIDFISNFRGLNFQVIRKEKIP